MPPTKYLLDNNIVSYFFNAGLKGELARIASGVPVVAVREVHEEASKHPSKGTEYAAWQPKSALTIRDIAVGGSASACLAALSGSTGSLKDLGELASIALAAEDPSLVLVCNDKAALWIALMELYAPGEHVVRFTTFLHRAHDAVGLTRAVVEKLAKHAQIGHAPPTWWSAWLAALP